MIPLSPPSPNQQVVFMGWQNPCSIIDQSDSRPSASIDQSDSIPSASIDQSDSRPSASIDQSNSRPSACATLGSAAAPDSKNSDPVTAGSTSKPKPLPQGEEAGQSREHQDQNWHPWSNYDYNDMDFIRFPMCPLGNSARQRNVNNTRVAKIHITFFGLDG